MKIINLGVAAALIFSPFSLEAFTDPCVKALTQSERDRYFREANLAIVKYYRSLDAADELADEFIGSLKTDAWKQACKACTLISVAPGTAYDKGVSVLIMLMVDFVDSDYFCGLSGKAKERLNQIDKLLAEAAGWLRTYERARTALMTDEHPKLIKGSFADQLAAQECLKPYYEAVGDIDDVLGEFVKDGDWDGDWKVWNEYAALIDDMYLVTIDTQAAYDAVKVLKERWIDFFDYRDFEITYGREYAKEYYPEYCDFVDLYIARSEHHLLIYAEKMGIRLK